MVHTCFCLICLHFVVTTFSILLVLLARVVSRGNSCYPQVWCSVTHFQRRPCPVWSWYSHLWPDSGGVSATLTSFIAILTSVPQPVLVPPSDETTKLCQLHPEMEGSPDLRLKHVVTLSILFGIQTLTIQTLTILIMVSNHQPVTRSLGNLAKKAGSHSPKPSMRP